MSSKLKNFIYAALFFIVFFGCVFFFYVWTYASELDVDSGTTVESSTELSLLDDTATITDALTVGDDNTIDGHLKNIELLLLILVIIIVSFVVHVLFRSVFSKLGK